MKPNPESTKLDRIRVVIGTVLAVAGAGTFGYAGVFAHFNLTLTMAAVLLVLSGLLIAGSHKLAQFITDIMR